MDLKQKLDLVDIRLLKLLKIENKNLRKTVAQLTRALDGYRKRYAEKVNGRVKK